MGHYVELKDKGDNMPSSLWDYPYNVVGDSDGNISNIGFSGNLVMSWAGSLIATIPEDMVDPMLM